ncbi:hypothetical protein ACIPW4_01550 [Pseudomonas sp. NPDC089996]|uniref:hypothetical protein n=1 Tax=Pseudomonas sp. NPDC089996 TaxID=3364474 RepID=UPI003816D5D0
MENDCDGKQEIMGSSQLPGQSALQDSFIALVEIALARRSVPGHGENDEGVPVFSYVLTPKQFDRVRKICREKGWDLPNQRGILMDLEAIAHPLDARVTKDRCTVAEVLDILLAAYSPQSQVGLNKPKHAQAIVFNTRQKVRIGKASFYAVAVVKIRVEGGRKYLAPVTAYHATEAKIRNIS